MRTTHTHTITECSQPLLETLLSHLRLGQTSSRLRVPTLFFQTPNSGKHIFTISTNKTEITHTSIPQTIWKASTNNNAHFFLQNYPFQIKLSEAKLVFQNLWGAGSKSLCRKAMDMVTSFCCLGSRKMEIKVGPWHVSCHTLMANSSCTPIVSFGTSHF